MGHTFKWLGSKEQVRELYENREALEKYLKKLKELMEPDENNDDNEPIADDDQ